MIYIKKDGLFSDVNMDQKPLLYLDLHQGISLVMDYDNNEWSLRISFADKKRWYIMKISQLLIVSLLSGSVALSAQNKKAEAKKEAPIAAIAPATVAPAASAEFSLLGSLGVAYSEATYVLTCGGPKVGIKYGDFWFSAGVYPSLLYSEVYKNANAATPVRPNLGAGFEIGYKKISIIAPVYFMPNNTYHYTFGLAYKFS